jgi:hypothetical protein
VMVSLLAQIRLVMRIKRASDYPAPAPATWEVMDSCVQALTVALHKTLSDMAEDGSSCPTVSAAGLRLIEKMAVEDTIDLDGLKVRVDLPTGHIEVVPANYTLKDRVHFYGTEDSLLMIAWDEDAAWGLAHLIKMPVKQFHAAVSGSDIRFVTPSLKTLFATVVGRKRRHVEVVSKMDNHVGLFFSDIPSGPVQMI